MNLNTPYWHKLLTEWRKNEGNGFTLPFIIGSQKYLNLKSSHQQNIAAIISEMAINPYDEISIAYCTDIKQIIFGIRDASKQNVVGEFIQSNNVDTKLFRNKIVDDLPIDLDQLIVELTERFQHYIDQKEYSVNNLEWTEFTYEEKKFISACF